MDEPNPCPTLINRLITRQSVTCVQEPYIFLTTKINENYLKCELHRGRDSERNTGQDAQTSTIGLWIRYSSVFVVAGSSSTVIIIEITKSVLYFVTLLWYSSETNVIKLLMTLISNFTGYVTPWHAPNTIVTDGRMTYQNITSLGKTLATHLHGTRGTVFATNLHSTVLLNICNPYVYVLYTR